MEITKSLSTILSELDHLSDYIKHRADIISNDPNRWFGNAHNNLPSFEYYLQSCVYDKGGAYDFTRKNYGNQQLRYFFDFKDSIGQTKKEVKVIFNYSLWKGTPFNYETKIS